jgi:hypothetical protein
MAPPDKQIELTSDRHKSRRLQAWRQHALAVAALFPDPRAGFPAGDQFGASARPDCSIAPCRPRVAHIHEFERRRPRFA